MSEKRSTRSSKYQHLLVEKAYSNDMMESFCTEDSIQARLNPFEYNEELLDLEDELKKEFWRVVDTLLTPRQKEVIKYMADGYTQMEIAKVLNVNQSSVVKNFQGNTQYSKDEEGLDVKRQYGGSKKRLIKISEIDNKILDILDRISKVREQLW
jgi:predicted DNA-binding protein YlxM (UPF0122 family)